MDYKEIRELAALMNEMGLTSLEYRGGGESVKLKRGAEAVLSHTDIMPSAPHAKPQREQAASTGGIMVKSPMVGVFYSAPAPDKEPYVSVGNTVHTGDILCIIEAMKIMNEITAECDGVIAEIYAEDRQVVEFGQPLFRIDPRISAYEQR